MHTEENKCLLFELQWQVKSWQVYRAGKKEHMHFLRWVLTLLSLHHFLLWILLSSLVWTQVSVTPPVSSLSLGKEEVSVCLQNEFSFLSFWSALALLLEHLHMLMFAVKGGRKHPGSCWAAWRISLFIEHLWLSGTRTHVLNCSLCQQAQPSSLCRNHAAAFMWCWAQTNNPC